MYVIIEGQNCMNVSYSKQSVKCLNKQCALLNANPRWRKFVTPDCENCVTAPHSCMYQCFCMMMYDRVNCMIVLQLWLHTCIPCERDDWNPRWRKFVTPDCENCVTVPHSCMYQCVCMMMYGQVNCMIVLLPWIYIYACQVEGMTGKIYTFTNMAGDQTLFTNVNQDLP